MTKQKFISKITSVPFLLIAFLFLCMLEGCEKKENLFGYTSDGKVLCDDSPASNQICIYLQDGKKIEKYCDGGEYNALYLKKSGSGYELSYSPTDRIGIAFYNNGWSETTSFDTYQDDIQEYLWSLSYRLQDHKVQIKDSNLVYKPKKYWDKENKVWMKRNTLFPVIEKEGYMEVIDGHPQRAFSFDPKYIRRIELRHI